MNLLWIVVALPSINIIDSGLRFCIHPLVVDIVPPPVLTISLFVFGCSCIGHVVPIENQAHRTSQNVDMIQHIINATHPSIQQLGVHMSASLRISIKVVVYQKDGQP